MLAPTTSHLLVILGEEACVAFEGTVNDEGAMLGVEKSLEMREDLIASFWTVGTSCVSFTTLVHSRDTLRNLLWDHVQRIREQHDIWLQAGSFHLLPIALIHHIQLYRFLQPFFPSQRLHAKLIRFRRSELDVRKRLTVDLEMYTGSGSNLEEGVNVGGGEEAGEDGEVDRLDAVGEA